MIIIKEKGFIEVPVYMRDYTEKEEYIYSVNHKGLEGKILKRSNKWWIISNSSKWIAMGKATKKEAVETFEKFVDDNFEILMEKGYLKLN